MTARMYCKLSSLKATQICTMNTSIIKATVPSFPNEGLGFNKKVRAYAVRLVGLWIVTLFW